MLVSRLATVLAFFTLGLTGCGISLAPYPGFNSGVARPDYHHIVMAASAADRQTFVRDGRMYVVPGPMAARMAKGDLPMEMRDEPLIELASSYDTMPIPQLRPEIKVTEYAEVKPVKPKVEALTMPTYDSAETLATLEPVAPSPRIDVQAEIEDLIEVESEVAIVRQDLLIQADPEPGVVNVAFSPELSDTVEEAAAGLPLLAASSSSVVTPEDAPESPSSSLLNTLDALASVMPDEAPTDDESSILSMSDEEVDILLVQLESDQSGYERVRNMTPEEKAKLRAQYEKRSFLGHFAKMDRNNDGALIRDEMLAYFTIMHAAFDVDYNDVVSREEAPTLLLRIKLLGQGFPASGLTLAELQRRLDETFVFLDKNKNDKLGWPELL